MAEENKAKYDLHVVIASGPENLSRAILGFAFAASAAVSDIKALTVLAGDGAAWIDEDAPRAQESLYGFSSVQEYVEILVKNDADICLCSACAQGGCPVGEGNPKILPKLCYSGLTELAIRTFHNAVQTIVF